MSSDINAIPAEDFLPGIFDARVDSLGTEWITDKKPAKYVGATQNGRFWLAVSSFGILGTAICPRIIQPLLDNLSFTSYEDLELLGGNDWSQVLNPTTSLLPGYDDALVMGDYYENQIAISVTLDDGESALPPFMAFDVQSRTLSMSPTAADIGSYSLHINYDCLKDPDPD